MTIQPVGVQQSVALGEGFELDLRPRRLRHHKRVLKLERIPLEILVLLTERPGEIVTREEIVARVWGNGVFLDTDNSIRGAVRKVRSALSDDPETPRFIQTVTGRGYRFIASVSSLEERSRQAPSPSETPTAATAVQSHAFESDGDMRRLSQSPGDEEERQREEPLHDGDRAPNPRHRLDHKWLFLGLVSLIIVSLVAALTFLRVGDSSTRATISKAKMTLAVLPFDNLSNDPDQEFFSAGLTDEMVAQIGKLNRDQLTVIARSSTAKYKGSKLTAREIGDQLNADYLVQGSVWPSAERVRITVQLVDAQKQTNLWTETYDRGLKDLPAVQSSVVSSIASEIHIALTEEQKTRLANPRETVPDAYVAYLKGRYYWNKRTREGMQKAEQYFQQAIDRDPTYAAAYSGLADCNSGLAWHGFKAPAVALPKAYTAARKAIEIDPQSAEAHASLGLVLSHRWDWPEAEAEFRRALQLDPRYANAHHWYGDYLSIQGRHEEAVSEAKRALELDPLNLMISTWLGLRYYMARNYSAAIEQNRDSVELDHNFAAAHLVLGEDYIQAGLHNEAIDELKRAAKLSGDSPLYTAQTAVALAVAGRRREALRIAHELEMSSKNRYVSPYGLAQIYAALNRDEDAFKWLHIAYDDHAVWVGYLAVDPIFYNYRLDHRFLELVRRVSTGSAS